jgi:hypothetical protein
MLHLALTLTQPCMLHLALTLMQPCMLHLASTLTQPCMLHLALTLTQPCMLQCSDLDATVHGASLPAVLLVTAVRVLRIPARRAPAVLHRAAARCTGLAPRTPAHCAPFCTCAANARALACSRAHLRHRTGGGRRGGRWGRRAAWHRTQHSDPRVGCPRGTQRQAAQCSAIHDSCAPRVSAQWRLATR